MNEISASYFNLITGKRVIEYIGKYLLNIYPSTYNVFDDNNPSNGTHMHDNFELVLITLGSCILRKGTSEYVLNAGDVGIIDPGVNHEITLSSSNTTQRSRVEMVHFQITISDLSCFCSNMPEELQLSSFLLKHNTVSKDQYRLFLYLKMIETCLRDNKNSSYGLKEAIKNLAVECLFSLLPKSDILMPFDSLAMPVIDRAMLYIGRNINHRISLDEIACFTCTSVRNLQYLFKKIFNKSVTEYINERKATVASELLKMNYKITTIGKTIGINPGQFSRFFKKYYGVTPSTYQKLNPTKGTNTLSYFSVEGKNNL